MFISGIILFKKLAPYINFLKEAFIDNIKTIFFITIFCLFLITKTDTYFASNLERSRQDFQIAKVQIKDQKKQNIEKTKQQIEEDANSKIQKSIPTYEYKIAKGDNLSYVFSKIHLNPKDLNLLIEADGDTLYLDTLKKNDIIKVWHDNNENLKQIEIHFDPANFITFYKDDDTFAYKETVIKGDWEMKQLVGEVENSFYFSAINSGFSPYQITRLATVFRYKVDFNRDWQNGDNFNLILNEQFIDGKKTGNQEILAFQIQNSGQTYKAFLYKDGQYYDETGDALAPGFLRSPLLKNFRISSNFNLKRLHPITKKVRPHLGTDYATPVGTPVVATANGIIEQAKHHRFAGNYLVINHNNNNKTRYLHLSKFLVKKGQYVERGDLIALSGNTGRSTGPHLHYELYISNRPVNSLKSSFAQNTQLRGNDKKEHLKKVAYLSALFENNKKAVTAMNNDKGSRKNQS